MSVLVIGGCGFIGSAVARSLITETKAFVLNIDKLTELPATVHKPWGTYATLKHDDGYQVKRISVAPGRKLSLQYHHKRAEHWVVMHGKAIVQVGDEEFETGPGEYCYIPLGEKQ